MPKTRVLFLEMTLIGLSLVLSYLLIHPIMNKVPEFPFLVQNFIFILLAINFTRYLFLLSLTPFSHSTWFKLTLLFLAIPILIYLMDWLSLFQEYKDNGVLLEHIDHLDFSDQGPIRKYIQNEYVFFGVAAIFTSFLIPFRMIISIWRVKNRSTV